MQDTKTSVVALDLMIAILSTEESAYFHNGARQFSLTDLANRCVDAAKIVVAVDLPART